MYCNWQLNKEGGLLLFFTERSKEGGYLSSVWKFNAAASLILALADSGYGEDSIIGRFRELGYNIGNGRQKRIREFYNKLGQYGLLETLKSCPDRLLGSFPGTGALPRPAPFAAPRVLKRKQFRGLAHEKWSRNLGKYASGEQFHYPLKVNFDVTRNCNLACPYCYLPAEEHAEDLPLEKIKLIIDRLGECNIQLINLFGGEPFAREDIFEIIEHCAKKGMEVGINTNGTLLNGEKIARLKELKVASLHISLDADSPETFALMRSTSQFDALVENIKASVRAGLPVQLNCTLTRANFTGLARMFALAEKAGVQTFSVGPFHSLGRGLKNRERFSVNETAYFLWVKLFSLFFSRRKTAFYIKERCDANTYIHIDHRGYCHYCSQMPRQMPLGNVLEQGPLEIWRSRAYKELFLPEFLGEPCRSCVFREIYCNSWRCRAEPAAERNDIFAGNPRCVRGKVSSVINRICASLSRCSS